MRKLIIAGGTGFLGRALEEYVRDDFEVYILTRSPHADHHIYWNGCTLGKWAEILEGAEAIINLSGKSVDCRYTESNKSKILSSRIESTQILQAAIQATVDKPKVWLNASSATIYIHSENILMDEDVGIVGDDFSMNVVQKWEKAFFSTTCADVRKVSLRTSIVLGNDGGAFPKMKMITKMGLGGHQGNGGQKVSWIHIDDFCRSVLFLLENKDVDGPVNITAPSPVSNKEFMKSMRHITNVKIGLPQPKFLLEIGAIMLRTETELLLKSRNVYPKRLLDLGFEFLYPNITSALIGLFTNKSNEKQSYTR